MQQVSKVVKLAQPLFQTEVSDSELKSQTQKHKHAENFPHLRMYRALYISRLYFIDLDKF